MDYDDDYPSCAKTDVLLRIFSNDISPEVITDILGVSPTETRSKGKLRNINNPKSINKVNCWYLGSKNHVDSKDCRRHLDWVIEKIYSKKEEFKKLNKLGVESNICCIWESSGNTGGPTISPTQMGPLTELEISVWPPVSG